MRTICLKNFDYASLTHKGLVRNHNEDFLAYFDSLNGHVFVLCDGMGGHSAGDVAAEMATEAVGRYFNAKYYKNPFKAVENSIEFANQEVVMHALGNDYLYGMGTTIVVVLIRDDRVFYGHAGDSRLYLFKNQQLKQLTKDHSYIQTLLDKGLISEEEAAEHPRRNEITRAVGLSYDFKPEVSSKAYIPEENDVLMLCSDGLTNMVNDKEISTILNSKYKINEKASKLIKTAKGKGGIDNISVQIIKFHNLSQNNYAENYDKKSSNIFSNPKIAFIVASIIILLLSFWVGIKDNEEKHHTSKSNNLQKNKFKLTEIIAYMPDENDTWETLADKFNISSEKLILLNPNVKHFDSTIHIKVPVRTSVFVMHFEDFEWLSKKYETKVIDIMKANDISTIYLQIGSEIIIPLNEKHKKNDRHRSPKLPNKRTD